MSLELVVRLHSTLPTRTSWQAEIDRTGLDVQLDPELDLAKAGDFSPTTIQGRA